MDLLTGTLLLSTLGLAGQSVTLRVESTLVHVPVSVQDVQGRPITGLQIEDFQVHDEGIPRVIENFFSDPAPVNLALLLDVSGSIEDEIEEVRLVALRFAQLFERKDRLTVVGFADRTHVLQPWTRRFKHLKRALKRLERGHRTALYDALQEVAVDTMRGLSGRKVILLVTDGLDNQSRNSYRDVLEHLIRDKISVYVIARTHLVRKKIVESRRVKFLDRVLKNTLDNNKNFVDIFFREKEEALTNLAEVTGGEAFFPKSLEELGKTYLAIAREVKNRYILTFRPPADSIKRFRSIHVSCSVPGSNLTFRERYAWHPPKAGK